MIRIVRAAAGLSREALRLLLRRPLAAVCAVAVDEQGRYLLIRRRDNGLWGLPGGFMDWGERIEDTLHRELREETGWRAVTVGRVVGIYSSPGRDPRIHSLCVAVEARVVPGPANLNPLEITDVRCFASHEVPGELAFDTRRILDDHQRAGGTVLA